MLNESVDVNGISGVILFRLVVPSIIYKYQIGRAFNAKGADMPVIFDVVNNFENLYSVGAIQGKLAASMQYFQAEDRGSEITAGRFRVIGEAWECQPQFKQLERTFGSSWDTMYQFARQ